MFASDHIIDAHILDFFVALHKFWGFDISPPEFHIASCQKHR